MQRGLMLLCVGVMTVVVSKPIQAEPAWWGRIVARPAEREVVRSTPVLERPYRPLHFYGNTVRRRYFRNWALPLPRDVRNGVAATVRRREVTTFVSTSG